jgi:hypothetical protein
VADWLSLQGFLEAKSKGRCLYHPIKGTYRCEKVVQE